MGSFVAGQPGGTSGDGSQQPLTWKDYVDLGMGIASGNTAAGAAVAGWTAKHATQVNGWSLVWNLIVGVVDDILKYGVELIGKLQGQDNPEFFGLLQAVLSDTLGIELPEGAVESAWRRGGDASGMRSAGGLFLRFLTGELGAQLPSPAGQGLAAAEGLLGYMMAFSVREANVKTLMSLIPEEYRFLDGFGEYASSLGRNLGLGRISRQAVQPWLKLLIQDPMTRELNAQYRPTKLGASAAIKANVRGVMSQPDMMAELAAEGYSDQFIQALQKDTLTQLALTDAWTLYKRGEYTSEQLTAAYTNSAMDPAVSGDWLAARIAAEVEPYTNALISDWKTQLAGGYITLAQFQEFVSGLHMLPDARDALLTAVGQLYDLPRRKLTLAEVQSAFVEGLMDATDVSAFLQREGYSDDDAQILWFQTMLKLGTAEAKKAVAQYAYDKAKAKAAKAGEPEPPLPAILAV